MNLFLIGANGLFLPKKGRFLELVFIPFFILGILGKSKEKNTSSFSIMDFELLRERGNICDPLILPASQDL